MFLRRNIFQRFGAVNGHSLAHGFRTERWARLAAFVFERVNGRTCQKQDMRREPPPFGISQVKADVALVQRSGPHNHRRVDARQWSRERSFGGGPLVSIWA